MLQHRSRVRSVKSGIHACSNSRWKRKPSIMPLNCGIVGLPNVGKSTIFNALTASEAQAANYPFCTIDPNVGIVPVPDTRMDRIVTMVKPNSIVPTTMEFVDIAGIVEG